MQEILLDYQAELEKSVKPVGFRSTHWANLLTFNNILVLYNFS